MPCRTILLAACLAALSSPVTAQVAEVEPNNACAQAQELGALPAGGVVVSGRLQGTVDQPEIDYYGFSTNGVGPDVVVEVVGADGGGGTLPDPYLAVLTQCGSVLARDDDGGAGADSRLVVPPHHLHYKVAVTSYPDADLQGFGATRGTYRLRITPVTANSGSLQGRLIDAEGSVTNFVTLTLRRCNPSCDSYVSSDGTWDGRVSFTGLVPGQRYAVEIRSTHHEVLVSPAVTATVGVLDLGDLVLTRLPSRRITGKLVRYGTLAPIQGAVLRLERPDPISPQSASVASAADGSFSFFGYGDLPLRAGEHVLSFGGSLPFQDGQELRFELPAAGDLALGTIELKGQPVSIEVLSNCEELPAAGGPCRFSVRVHNDLPTRLRGQVWAVFRGAGTAYQIGTPLAVDIAPFAVSPPLAFVYRVPGFAALDGYDAAACPEVYVGRGTTFFAVQASIADVPPGGGNNPLCVRRASSAAPATATGEVLGRSALRSKGPTMLPLQ
jgi:hypothetical protein